MCCNGKALCTILYHSCPDGSVKQLQLRPYPGIHEVMMWVTRPANREPWCALHCFTTADGFRAYL